MTDMDEVALARRVKCAKTWNINPLVAEIVEILMVYGGSAHRNLVAERIAVEAYRQMIAMIGDKDPTTKRMLEAILADEEEHADELKDLLEA